MTWEWQRTLFWLAILALLFLAIHLLSAILLPFVLGSVIAFLLNPLVKRLVRLKVPRTLATVMALLAFLAALIVFVLLLAPLLESQVVQLVKRLPGYVAALEAQVNELSESLADQISADTMQRLREAASNQMGEVFGTLGTLLSRVLTGGVAVANILSLVFITPIVAFFLLRDWTRIIATLDSWMPRQHLATIRKQAWLINETLSGFVLGQASVCLIMGAFYAVGLTLIGLESGAVIGFCVGILIFIPFLGGLTGAAVSIALAFAQFGPWHKPIWVAVLFAVGQTLEGNVITPKLIGDRVHLHPVWIIFSLLAFGELLGLLGVLIAVPAAAVLGVLVRFAMAQYLESALYDPKNEPAPEPPP